MARGWGMVQQRGSEKWCVPGLSCQVFLWLFVLTGCQNQGFSDSPSIPSPVVPDTDYSVTFDGLSPTGSLERSAILTNLPFLKVHLTPADTGHDNGSNNLGRDDDLSIQLANVVLGFVFADGREVYQTYQGSSVTSADYGAAPQPGTPRTLTYDWKKLNSNLLSFSTWASGITSIRVHTVVYYHSSPSTSWAKVTEIPLHQDLVPSDGFGYSISWNINLDAAPEAATTASRAWVEESESYVGGRGVFGSKPQAPDAFGNLPTMVFPCNFRPSQGDRETWKVKLDIDGDGTPEFSWLVPEFSVIENYTGLVGNVFFDAGSIAIEVL